MSLLKAYSNKIEHHTSVAFSKFSHLSEFNSVHLKLLQDLMISINLDGDLDFQLLALYVNDRVEYRNMLRDRRLKSVLVRSLNEKAETRDNVITLSSSCILGLGLGDETISLSGDTFRGQDIFLTLLTNVTTLYSANVMASELVQLQSSMNQHLSKYTMLINVVKILIERYSLVFSAANDTISGVSTQTQYAYIIQILQRLYMDLDSLVRCKTSSLADDM